MIDEKQTAYHEAGHCIISYKLKPYAVHGKVTIIPTGNNAGAFNGEAESIDFSDAYEEAISLFAGYAAEKKYSSTADICYSQSDTDKAVYLIQFINNENEESLRKKADNIVNEYWYYIEIIAELLYKEKQLDGDIWTLVIDCIDEGQDWEHVIQICLQINRFSYTFQSIKLTTN